MLKNFLFLFLGVTAYVLTSCGGSSSEPPLNAPPVPVVVEPLGDSLFNCRSIDEVSRFLSRHPFLAEVYFPDAAPSAPADSTLARELYRHINNDALRGFKQQIDSLYEARHEPLTASLAQAFGNIRHYFPDFKAPRVITMTTGFMGRDLYVSDSLILIGLDYFGGPRASYRPDVYAYQLPRYQPDYLLPSVLFVMSERYIRMDVRDKTLLSDMIGYGKAFAFVKHCAPQLPDSLVVGFRDRDLTRLYNSQAQIWAFFVEGKLLYETNAQKKQKYSGERPFTPEIGPEVPGGVGRWLGWRIVSSYLSRNPDVTLPELLKSPDARKIFQESGYKGQKEE